MRVIFMGTPEFSVPSLAALVASGYEVVAAYSQPPRPRGRKYEPKPSPVHEFASAHGIEVRTPVNFKVPGAVEAFAELGADVAIVVAYGLILPKSVLEAPTYGCLNLHASLLPRWRGAAPIQRAIMAGDGVTGIQVMQMEKGLDTGPILLSETVPIATEDTAGTLAARLSSIGADMLPRALGALSRGALVPQAQATEGVTYAHKITSEDARVNWSAPAAEVDAHIRGLNPAPGAWCELPTEKAPIRLKLHQSSAETNSESSESAPGTVVAARDDALIVQCGDQSLVAISQLQRPGKQSQAPGPFLRGQPVPVGTVLA